MQIIYLHNWNIHMENINNYHALQIELFPQMISFNYVYKTPIKFDV